MNVRLRKPALLRSVTRGNGIPLITVYLSTLLLTISANAGTATVTDDGAKNLGSSAAYVATCEKEGLLAIGTLADLMFEMQQALTPDHWQRVKTQYQISLHDKRQYTVAKNKWIPFRINSDSCSDLGKALPMIKTSLRKYSR